MRGNDEYLKTINGGYKYDTHIHTSQVSSCGYVTGAAIVDYYKELGYNGLMITDHFIGSNNFLAKDEKDWNKKVDKFLIGYYDAKQRGENIDFDVLLGMEFCYKNTEFIFTNLTVEQLYDGEKALLNDDLIEVLQWVHNNGGFIIHVHPFRLTRGINTIRLIPDYVDAVEVFNAGNIIPWPKANAQAEYYARQFEKKETSGSDFHNIGSALMGGMVFPHRIQSEYEFVKAIQADDYSLITAEL